MKYLGTDIEIQIITPMTRGSLGTVNLNRMIQEYANPSQRGKAQLQVGDPKGAGHGGEKSRYQSEADLSERAPAVRYRVKNISSGEVNATASGVVEFRELAEKSKELFISRKQTILNSWSPPDKMTIEVTFEGVLASDLQSTMRAGETLRLNVRSEYTFRDGKICRIIDVS